MVCREFVVGWEKEIARRERRKGKEFLGIRMEFRKNIVSISLVKTVISGEKTL
jgi:hypothetical protein